MTFETEYKLKQFREEQPELFNSEGKAFSMLSHVEPMTRMLELINSMEVELKSLEGLPEEIEDGVVEAEKSDCYVAVPIEKRLPEKGNENYLTISSKGFEKSRFFNGERFETAHYEGEIIYWLEKRENVYCLSEDEFKKHAATHPYTKEEMKSAYGCGWGDAVIETSFDSGDENIMLKKFTEFMKRTENIKSYLKYKNQP